MEISSANSQGKYYWLIGILSVAIPVVVALLLFKPSGMLVVDKPWVYFLPHLNGMINSATAVFLVLGVYFIKNRNESLHKLCMNISFILGSIFLVSYVVYHASSEPTSFGGEGLIKTVYFALLISHIILAAVVVPFVLLAFYFAWTENFKRHRKIVKFTFPIWLYVSITGVIVYLMISPYFPY
ncbi:DUF420 domain-containing protein [Flexithrix dorotheae]|uniref:DUF420 domain-containing protein n=1 Tax=Flexithrix dorotheae TaxID=70993 RepID=UPI000374DBDA|nr:DUF420 domain-containing protein [Flexithrix dorotheae]